MASSNDLYLVRKLVLDGNPLPEQSYHLLIGEDSMWVIFKHTHAHTFKCVYNVTKNVYFK